MHTGTVILEERFGHEGHGVAVLDRDVLGNVLVHHDAVCLFQQGVKAHTELYLTAGGDFMMMFFNIDAASYH